MSTVSRLYPLSGLAALVLVGCSSQPAQPLKKGEKAVDVASVVRQKMPASVKDRDAWAQDLAKTFESQKLAPTVENICSVLAVAQQESNYQADPAVPNLSKIAWKEIDRRAERMHIPQFVVHTALKINSPTGKSYSERLDTVKTEKQLSAIFDDFINMVPMGQTLFGSLNPVHTGGPMQVSIAFAEQHADGSWTLTTTAGLIAPTVAATTGLSEFDLCFLVIAIACGATVLSHFNDSGFWLVGRFLNMDEKTTLRTWTVMETLLGSIGFTFALIGWWLL